MLDRNHYRMVDKRVNYESFPFKEAERHKRGKILYVLVLHTFPLVLGPRDPYCSRTYLDVFSRDFLRSQNFYTHFLQNKLEK